MPSVIRAVEVKLPEAELLADLYGIIFDLDNAEEFCNKVIDLAKSKPRDLFMEEGLVSAAVIKYGRCFTKGVRMRLGVEDLASLDTDSTAAHEYFIELRHKFVAHSVNAFEETYVTASAMEKDGEKFPITSVGPGQHRVVLSAEIAELLRRLVHNVKQAVKRRIDAEEKKLLEFIKTLPLEAVHAGDLHTPRNVKVADVRKPRIRGVHSNKSLRGRRMKHTPPDISR